MDNLLSNSVLRPCAGFWNDPRWNTTEARAGDPVIGHVAKAIFTPMVAFGKWGVFDLQGTIIRDATDYKGPQNEDLVQVPEMPCSLDNVVDGGVSNVIFGGRINLYYGHFLFETLPRLWSVAQHGLGGRKVLVQAQWPMDQWINHHFVQVFLSALGIQRSDIIQCTRPEIYHDVEIALPCLRQNAWVYPQATQELFTRIGSNILGDAPRNANSTPVYISKTKLTHKISGIVNEIEIENILKEKGVDIVYPETMSIKDQLLLFRDREVILGTVGSAFHSAGFAQSQARQIMIAHGERVNPNYGLLDIAFNSKTEYYYTDLIAEVGKTSDTGYALHCKDTRAVAESLLKLIS
ncbi:glycosyltransferase family 61 protein [Labrys neptuniae]